MSRRCGDALIYGIVALNSCIFLVTVVAWHAMRGEIKEFLSARQLVDVPTLEQFEQLSTIVQTKADASDVYSRNETDDAIGVAVARLFNTGEDAHQNKNTNPPVGMLCSLQATRLSDFRSADAMQHGGWSLHNFREGLEYGKTFRGWCPGTCVAYMETKLLGTGVLRIILANEYGGYAVSNVVSLYKNGLLVSRLGRGEKKTVYVDYKNGDTIKIDEHHAILRVSVVGCSK